MCRARCVSIAFAISLLQSAAAHAITLDWDAVTWTAGTLSNGYNVDPSKAGNDITVAISGNTNKLQTDPVTGTATPANVSSLRGGLASPEKSLHIYVDAGTQTEITVTITFSALYVQGVENVSFRLFDIDKTSDSEFIKSITATSIDGTTQLAPNITGLGSSIALSGSGLTQLLTGNTSSANSGAGSGNGNATIGFGPNAIRSFYFTFDNSSGPPRVQEFALFDITFTPVPEINPAAAAFGACLVAAAVIHRRRRAA